MGFLMGGMGMRSNTKAGSIGSAIGPALGKDGGSLSQDLGGCAPTATGHDLGHPCLCAGPGHGKLSIVGAGLFLTKSTNKVIVHLLRVNTLFPGGVKSFFGSWSLSRTPGASRQALGRVHGHAGDGGHLPHRIDRSGFQKVSSRKAKFWLDASRAHGSQSTQFRSFVVVRCPPPPGGFPVTKLPAHQSPGRERLCCCRGLPAMVPW